MNTRDEVIAELVSLIVMQNEELDKLREKINRIKQYLEVYEEYLESRDR